MSFNEPKIELSGTDYYDVANDSIATWAGYEDDTIESDGEYHQLKAAQYRAVIEFRKVEKAAKERKERLDKANELRKAWYLEPGITYRPLRDLDGDIQNDWLRVLDKAEEMFG